MEGGRQSRRGKRKELDRGVFAKSQQSSCMHNAFKNGQDKRGAKTSRREFHREEKGRDLGNGKTKWEKNLPSSKSHRSRGSRGREKGPMGEGGWYSMN